MIVVERGGECREWIDLPLPRVTVLEWLIVSVAHAIAWASELLESLSLRLERTTELRVWTPRSAGPNAVREAELARSGAVDGGAAGLPWITLSVCERRELVRYQIDPVSGARRWTYDPHAWTAPPAKVVWVREGLALGVPTAGTFELRREPEPSVRSFTISPEPDD